jgi:peptide/nickel transport system ATP-binding protein
MQPIDVDPRDRPARVEELSVLAGARRLLDRVEVELPPRSVTALLGPSGSGKSTLLWALAGASAAGLRVRGHFWLGPVDLLQDRRERVRRVGLMPQDAEAVLDPRQSALAALGLSHPDPMAALARQRFPLSRARARPFELSGGERRRLLLAIAVSRSPDILLVDEPTVGLDPELAAELRDVLLDGVRRLGARMVMATHDFDLARAVADHVVWLFEGRVVEQGLAATLLDTPRSDPARALLAAERRRRTTSGGD